MCARSARKKTNTSRAFAHAQKKPVREKHRRGEYLLNNQQAMEQAHLGIRIGKRVLQRREMNGPGRHLLQGGKNSPQIKDRTAQMGMAQDLTAIIRIRPFLISATDGFLRPGIRRRKGLPARHRRRGSIQKRHHTAPVYVEVHQHQHQHTQHAQRMTPVLQRISRGFVHLLLLGKNFNVPKVRQIGL